MSYSTQFSLLISGVGAPTFLQIVNKLNILGNLKNRLVLVQQGPADIEMYVSSSGVIELGSARQIRVDIHTLYLCAMLDSHSLEENTEDTAAEQMNIFEIVEQFGKEQFGKIIWSKYSKEEKFAAVVDHISKYKETLINESKVGDVIAFIETMMNNETVYLKNCNAFNTRQFDNLFQSLQASVEYLLNLITFCKSELNYDPTSSVNYWKSETQLTAHTGIKLLDNFTNAAVNNTIHGLSLPDVMQLLSAIYETQELNKIFINNITQTNSINDIYGRVILSMNKNISNQSFSKEDGVALMHILEKTPKCFLPSLGNTEDPITQLNLFKFIDCKYLEAKNVSSAVEQLCLILKRSNLARIDTCNLYRIKFELEAIKTKSFKLYGTYECINAEFMKRVRKYTGNLIQRGYRNMLYKKFTSQLSENITLLIKHIKDSNVSLVDELYDAPDDYDAAPDDYDAAPEDESGSEDESDTEFNPEPNPKPVKRVSPPIKSKSPPNVNGKHLKHAEPSSEEESTDESDDEVVYEPEPVKPKAQAVGKVAVKPLKKIEVEKTNNIVENAATSAKLMKLKK
jgi:hypothetical protein